MGLANVIKIAKTEYGNASAPSGTNMSAGGGDGGSEGSEGEGRDGYGEYGGGSGNPGVRILLRNRLTVAGTDVGRKEITVGVNGTAATMDRNAV